MNTNKKKELVLLVLFVFIRVHSWPFYFFLRSAGTAATGSQRERARILLLFN